MERSATPEYNGGNRSWASNTTKYKRYNIDAGNGLLKEIRFQNEPRRDCLINNYLRSGDISEKEVIKLANRMLLERQRVMEQVSKGLATFQGQLTFDAAVQLILAYLGTITGGMEFELHNFTEQNDWAQPRKWNHKDGDYHEIWTRLTCFDTSLKEWDCPGLDWLYSKNLGPSWQASASEHYLRGRQGFLLFGTHLPEPNGWDFTEFRKRYAGENVPCEENVVSENELICSFLGQIRSGYYREYRVRYTNEMVDFDVADMHKLMTDVAKMTKEHANSTVGMEDLWTTIRNSINPNNAKYLYAMLKQGNAAIKRFERENFNDERPDWHNVGPLSSFFQYFSRTIHYKSPDNKKDIPNIVHMSGDGVSGVEFIRSIKYQKNGVPDYGEYTFGVEEPRCEKDLFPPLLQKGEKTNVETYYEWIEKRKREQEEKEELEKNKVLPSQELEETVLENVSQAPEAAKNATSDESEAELAAETLIDLSRSAVTYNSNRTTGKNTSPVQELENTEEKLVAEPHSAATVPKSNDTGTSRDQNIEKAKAPASHTSTDNKTPPSQSKQKSAKNQKKAKKNGKKPAAKKELAKEDSVDSTSSSQSPPSTEFSGSAGDTPSVAQSDTEAEKDVSVKMKGEVKATAEEKTEVVDDLKETVPVGDVAEKADNNGDQAVEEEKIVENAVDEVNGAPEVVEAGPTKTSIRKAKRAAKLQRENDERAAKAAAKLKAHETLVATAKDGSFTEAKFDITIKKAPSSSSSVVPKDPNNVIVESNFSGEKATMFVNDMLLAAAGDLFKVPDVPDVPGKKYDIQYTLLEEEEAENSDEYVPGSTVFHDYRPGVRGNRSRSSSHEGTSNDVHGFESFMEEDYASQPIDSTSKQPGPSAPVNNHAVAKPAANRRAKGKGHQKKSGKGKAGQANGGKATTGTSTLVEDEGEADYSGGLLNPHNGNTPMIDFKTPELAPPEKLARVSDPDVHDMCRRLKFLADKKAIGGLKNVEKKYQVVARQRLQKFLIAYQFRLRMAKAMLHIIDIDPCEDLSGEKEMAVLRLAMSYMNTYRDAEDCLQGRQIDEITSGGTFMNGRESDSIEKGLRFVDLKMAELRKPDPTFNCYYLIAQALNRATDEQKLVMSLVKDGANFSGYLDYL